MTLERTRWDWIGVVCLAFGLGVLSHRVLQKHRAELETNGWVVASVPTQESLYKGQYDFGTGTLWVTLERFVPEVSE